MSWMGNPYRHKVTEAEDLSYRIFEIGTILLQLGIL